MRIVYIILFIFVLMAFLLSIYLMRHEQIFVEKKQQKKPNAHTYIWTSDTDHKTTIEKQIHYKWPQLDIVLESIAFENVVLYHYRGLSTSSRTIGIRLAANDALEGCMNAISRFDEKHKVPFYSFWLIIPTTQDTELAYAQAQSFFDHQQIKLQYILKDGLDMKNLKHQDLTIATIGVMDQPFFKISFSNDNLDYDWLFQIDTSTLSKPVSSKIARHTTLSILKKFDLFHYFLVKFHLCGTSQMVRYVSRFVPDCRSMFYPSIEKKNDYILLHAPDMNTLKDCYENLQKNAEKYQVSLQLLQQYNGTECVTYNDYKKIEAAVKNSFVLDCCIPVSYQNDEYHLVDSHCKTITFAPTFLSQNISHEGYIRFYDYLLVHADGQMADTKW